MLLTCLLPLSACTKNATGPAVTLTPFTSPKENKQQLLGTITVRGIEGSIATLSEMAKDLRLPFGAADLRAMLLARAGVPESLIQHLDLRAPVGFAAVSSQRGTSPFTASSMAAKSPQAAKAFVGAMGSKLREEKGAVAVRTQAGTEMWIYADGALLVGSDSLEGLRAAGAHAIASRRSTGEDVVARFFPEAYARAKGTDVPTALREIRAEVMAQIRSAPKTSPLPSDAMAALAGAGLSAFIDPLAETEVLDLALAIDPKLGIRLLSRLLPKPRSALAKTFANVKPYALDGALVSGSLPAGLFAVNYSPDALKRYQQALQEVAGINLPGVSSMVAGLQTLAGTLTGAQSGRFSFDRGIEHTLIAQMHSGASAESTMAGVESFLGPAGLASLVRETHRQATLAAPPGSPAPPAPQVSWQRQGLKGQFSLSGSTSNGGGRSGAALFNALGGDRFTYSVMVNENRLLMTSSPEGYGHLAKFITGSKGAPTDPELRQVLKETAGREGFVYVDLFRLLRPAMATAAKTEPSLAQANAVLAFIPGVDKLRVPAIASYVGGKQLTVELAIPYRTLQNLSALLAPLLGLGLGSGLLGPQ